MERPVWAREPASAMPAGEGGGHDPRSASRPIAAHEARDLDGGWPPNPWIRTFDGAMASTDRSRAQSRLTYMLYVRGHRVGLLEWRSEPGRQVGWYLTCGSDEGPRRLDVDPSVDELAETAGRLHDFDLEFAALLSAGPALDAAGRIVGAPRAHFAAPEGGRYELRFSGVDPAVVTYVVPELRLETRWAAKAAGQVPGDALADAIARIRLLGGRVLGVIEVPS
jgi:hypothetical protein